MKLSRFFPAGRRPPALAALPVVVVIGAALALLAPLGASEDPLVRVGVLLALVVRQGSRVERPAYAILAPLVTAFVFLAIDDGGAAAGSMPSPSFLLALLVVPALAFSAGAWATLAAPCSTTS